MSFQFNPIDEPEAANDPSTQQGMQLQVCPHLGLYDDPALVLTEASDSHRCFARSRPTLPGYEHQEMYCLRAAHTECPYFTNQHNESVAPVPSPFSEPFRSLDSRDISNPPRRWPALLAALIGATMLGAAALFASDYINNIQLPTSITEILGSTVVVTSVSTPVAISTPEPTVAAIDTPSPTEEAVALASTPTVEDASTATSVAPTLAAVEETAATNTVTTTEIAGVENITQTVAATSTTESNTVSILEEPALEFATPTPLPGGMVLSLTPRLGNIGWWQTNDRVRNHLNDSFLYAGVYEDQSFISLMRFELTEVPRGAKIVDAELRLTGLRDNRFRPEVKSTWLVQLIAESELRNLIRSDFLEIYAAPASIILFPQLSEADLAVDKVNSWKLDDASRQWLEKQIFDGAKTISVRILTATDNQEDSLFAWDSGLGPESLGNAPTLILSMDQPPLTPLPTITKEVIVATLTPTPENVLTEVALAATATEVATAIGTYTPPPFDVVTPTPLPNNVETAQAIALLVGELPVVIDTPTPGNESTATAVSNIATAVARTTGTYTPVPFPYNTPALVVPSPPAENVATLAARVATATAEASITISETATPLPYNAVLAEFVYATEIPQNRVTEQAQTILATAEAQTTGTPTPLPWNAVIITRVPTPRSQTAGSAGQSSSQSSGDETTPEATPQPSIDFAQLRNKIVYRRSGQTGDEVWLYDPATGSTTQIGNAQAMAEVEARLGIAPDGRIALAERDDRQGFQIAVRGTDGATEKITDLKGLNYDAAWSPNGDQIAFVSNQSGDEEIYVISPSGQNLRQLTFSPRFDKHPTWSPDGSKIVFYSTRNGKRQLWIMNADGSEQTLLTQDDVEEFDPVWVR